MNSETKVCQNCKSEFVIEPDDFAFYEKMKVPPPTFCPECRFQRRALWRNEQTLYTRNCARCGTRMVSMYNPASPYTVWCLSCFDSDQWNPYEFGMGYDLKKPFFEQFGQLMRKVPKRTLYQTTKLGPNINSEYTNVAGGNKDCYLLFNGGKNEEAMYSRGLLDCKNTLDAYFGQKLERCYEVINTHHSHSVQYGYNVRGSLDSMFILNGSGLQHCFGCVNLRNKSYHFMNQLLSPKEYQKRVEEVRGSYQKMEAMKKKFDEFSLQFPRRENNNIKATNSSGDYLFECKNVHNSFEVETSEDCNHVFSIKHAKDCYDCVGYSYYSERQLEGAGTGSSQRAIGCALVELCQDIMYSFDVKGSNNCTGCDGLRNAQFCILNKQYSEDEYKAMQGKIIEELKGKNLHGLSMPPEIAPFAYNESVAQNNVPLTREEVIKQGFRWQDDIQVTKGKETIEPAQLPDHIQDVPDTIVNEVLVCISCGRNYKIIERELQFYRSTVLPLPRKCFNCRFSDRIVRRGSFTLFNRNCARCKKEIKTNYAPDRPEIVYCEECYQKEVV